MIKRNWFDIYGTFKSITVDPQFCDDEKSHLRDAILWPGHEVSFKSPWRPARDYNKIGCAESINSSIRLFVQWRVNYQKDFQQTSWLYRPDSEIQSKAKFRKT